MSRQAYHICSPSTDIRHPYLILTQSSSGSIPDTSSLSGSSSGFSSGSSFDYWDNLGWPDTSSSCKNCTSTPLEIGLVVGLTLGTIPTLLLLYFVGCTIVALVVGMKRRILGGSEAWERLREGRKEERRKRKVAMIASGVGGWRVWWYRDMIRKCETLMHHWKQLRNRREKNGALDVDLEMGVVEVDGKNEVPREGLGKAEVKNIAGSAGVDRDKLYEALIQELGIKSPEAVSILKLKTEKEKARMDLEWIRRNREVWHGCRKGKAHVRWYNGRFGGSSYRKWGSCRCEGYLSGNQLFFETQGNCPR